MPRLRHFLLLSALLICAAVGAQTVNESLSFDHNIHDFGTINELDGKVTHRFRVTNTGKQPVAFLHARSGCNCVIATTPKTPLKPGKSDYITVTYDPEYRPGQFSKEIVVFTDGKRYNRLWVKGDVKAGVHPLADNYPYALGAGLLSNYKILNFGGLRHGESRTMKLRFGNDGKTRMNLAFYLEKPDPDFTVDIPAGFILRPGAEGSLPVTVKVSRRFEGTRKATLLPVANGRTLQPVIIEITCL